MGLVQMIRENNRRAIMKKLMTFIVCLCFLLPACSSAPKSKAEPATSPMKAAKTFVQALTTGDEVLLNTVIYHSQSMPAGEIMNIAKMRKITGMEKTDFTYTKDLEDNDTVIVSFKASEGQQDKWRLVFVKNDKGNGNYQYDGFLSGSLLANSTPEIATKTYLKGLRKGAGYWLNNMAYEKETGAPNQVHGSEYFHQTGIYKHKHLNFSQYKTFPDYQAVRMITKIRLDDGKEHTWVLDFRLKEDGYYYAGENYDPAETLLNIF
jgi:hypothetical protein